MFDTRDRPRAPQSWGELSKAQQGCVGCVGVSLLLVVGIVALIALGGSGPKEMPTASEGTPQERIEAYVNERFGDRARTVTVTEMPGDSREVYLEFKAQTFTAYGIEREKKDVYREIFTSDLGVSLVGIGASREMVDAGGNTSEQVVYRTGLTAEDAERVDWENVEMASMAGIWSVGGMHPDLRE